MGKKVRIQLAPGDRDRLKTLIANGNTPQKHVRRARIVLLAGAGIGTDEIQRRLGASKPTIRRWRTRYVEAGVDGLCRDKTRPPGKAPLGTEVVNRVIGKTLTEAPPDATHWSLRGLARAAITMDKADLWRARLAIKGTSKNDTTDVKLGRSRGSRGSRAGFSVFSGSPAGLCPTRCGLQADSSPECHHVGAAAARHFSCTRRRML